MPTYSFKCDSCDHEFDTIRKIAERESPESEPCPACKTVGTVKRFHGDLHIGWSDAVQLGIKKAPADWRNWLKVLQKNTRGSADNINVG